MMPSIEEVRQHESNGHNWVARDPEYPGTPTIIRLRIKPEDPECIEVQNGLSFWQPLSECRWAERSAYHPVSNEGMPVATAAGSVEVPAAEPRYWFMSWEEISTVGGAINQCAAVEGHPFEFFKRLRQRHSKEHSVIITPLFFRPITADEYKLAEESGVVPV